MRLKWPLVTAVLGTLCWLAACYALRYLLMENTRWVELCDGASTDGWCRIRSGLGLVIHFQVLPVIALALALPAFVLRDRPGRALAWAGLLVSLPALALYTVTPAVFSLLLSLLRLVRRRLPANAS